MKRGLLAAALAICWAAAVPARAAPALVRPTFLLNYGAADQVNDYRPAINAAGTRIVFERTQAKGDSYTGTIDLFITDLANPAPQRLVTSFRGSTRPDWCWFPNRPVDDGPIAFSGNTGGVYTMPPKAGSQPSSLANSGTWIYPVWYPSCAGLAVYDTAALTYMTHVGPESLAVNVATGFYAGSLSGRSLWAGFDSVNRQFPGLVAFAGQQFNASGYDQMQNYVYLADANFKPPQVRPLDREASTSGFDPNYQGRAPTWSPDGRWIVFESNRACTDKGSYAIFVQNGLGRQPALQVTDCKYNVQHAKWYRYPVDGRILVVATSLLYPDYTGTNNLLKTARGIASLDVTAFLEAQRKTPR